MKISPPSLAILALLLALSRPAAGAGELWVAPDGADANPGTAQAPLASLPAALARLPAARLANADNASNACRILLRDGVYPLAAPLRFDAAACPANGTVQVAAAPGAHPCLSGGRALQDWKLEEPSARNPIWMAKVPKAQGQTLEFRQLWVNGRKATRARQPNDGQLARLVAWDKTNQVATLPAALLAGIQEPHRLELIVDQVWEIAILRVASIQYVGTNALLTFQQPESRLEFQHPWPPVTVNAKYQAPCFLANAKEFLDTPGEWFEDVAAGKVYYWPRPDEDLTRATVIVPALETLVEIAGTPDHPAANLEFRGIDFAHTTWLRPSQQGHVPLQAGMAMLDVKKLSPKGTPYHPGLDNLAWITRLPAAVTVQNAQNIRFTGCTFEHLAATGLDFISGTRDDLVDGCTFHDLGGNGLQLGKFSDTNVETHVPYNPSDPGEICTRETLSNNLVSDCANEDWGCVGIGVGYARQVAITHNELFDLPYTGISVGWGWTKMTNALGDNLILANRLHHVGQRLGDLGGIYLLSAQPGTVVAENAISNMAPSPWVPDPQHWFYLYLDEGSSGITVRDNWCPSEQFLKNDNGPGNTWTHNGPQVSPSIQAAAGLEPAYRNTLSPQP